MEFIGSTLDLDLAFDDQSGESLSPLLSSHPVFVTQRRTFLSFAGDVELQDNSLFASSNNSYVSINCAQAQHHRNVTFKSYENVFLFLSTNSNKIQCSVAVTLSTTC